MATHPSLEDAAALAEAGQWAAARDAYGVLVSRDQSADAHLGLARACWWLGQPGRARDHAERAFAGYEEAGRHAEAAMVGVHLCIWYLTNLDNGAAAQGWLARARHLSAGSGDARVAGWVTLVSGYLAGDLAEGRRLIEAASATAESLSDRDLSTMSLADLGLWHVASGDTERGMGMLDEAMATTFAEPRPMLEVVVWSSCDMLAACSLADDARRATQWCQAADRFMETYGCPFLQVRCRAHYGRVLVAAGRWDEAETELREALSMAADTGGGPRTEALTGLAELRRRQGRPEEALVLLDSADDTPAGTVSRAACLRDLGEAAEAGSVLRGALALVAADAADRPLLVAALAETELAAGRPDAAAEVLRADGSTGAGPSLPRAAGLLARAAGRVAAAHGDLEVARQRLGFALDVFTRLELPFEAACTELELARTLLAVDPPAAAGRARSAYARFEQLGARHRAAEAAALLRALGVTPPPGPRRAQVLSVRELDVLALVAEGLSNPDIAGRLFLSPRTVGHHVSSILRKLDLRSRSEAAAYAAREGIRAGPR